MPRIKWKGEDLGAWSGKPTLKECRLIKSELGLGPMEFQEKFEEMDPDAWSIFVAIMLTRSGRPTNFEDVDGEFDDLEVVRTDAEKSAGAKAEAEEAGKAPSGASESGASESNKSDSSTKESPTSTDS